MTSAVRSLLEQHFDTAFAAPEGMAKLRELILTLAMQGKLVAQDPSDPPASELLKEIERERASREDAKARRKRKLPPIEPEEVPYELPQGWEWVRLGEIAEIIRGITFPSNEKTKTPAPGRIGCLRTANVQKEIEWDDLLFIDSSFVKRDSQYIRVHDIVMSMANSRELVGKVAIVRDIPTKEATFGGFLGVIRPYNISSHYILNLLTTDYARSSLIGSASQTTNIANISLGKLNPFLVPIPPLPEQQRIVARIDQLMARCDELEELRKKREEKRLAIHAAAVQQLLDPSLRAFASSRETKEPFAFLARHFGELHSVKENVAELRKAILQLGVMGHLVPQDPNDPPASELLKEIKAEKQRLVKEKKIRKPKPLPPIKSEEVPYELPPGWEWVRLGDVSLSNDSGWSPQCLPEQRTHGKWGVLKVSAVSWGRFNPDENKALPSDKTPRPECEVKVGDFLLSRANTDELVARSVIVEETPEKLMMSDKIVRFEISQHINKHFINIANSTEFSRTYYIANASGTSSSMKNVSRQVMAELPIPLPPLPEQQRIVARIDQLMALCDTLDQQIDAAGEKQTELLNAVMAQV